MSKRKTNGWPTKLHPVTIRLFAEDIALAKRLAREEGFSWQLYARREFHMALRRRRVVD